MNIEVLIVEDDLDLGHLLCQYLIANAVNADLVRDTRNARQALASKAYDMVLLDVMLPMEDGFSFASTLKIAYPNLPFLFLTARTMKEDVLKGLRLGADDYIHKPFDADELILRIGNILKRNQSVTSAAPQRHIGDYLFEPDQLKLTFGSHSDMLTQKENALLEMLSNPCGNLVSRQAVLESLWGNADFFNGRSLDVFIRRLRKLLEKDPKVRLESLRGVGFILHVS